ncbi:hypothetical protein [Tenggerimyces flavus]|uniref:Uncharacterized protein n=1 Tax=Tenggerimyces flavus TaxID=1708749 RepID=A0ABV7Y796_9ACTN|nr:hypothetical protein [Tenggerimyces flavus]MBM7791019.1 hypothetical protein [Tenggerimyces flavus]
MLGRVVLVVLLVAAAAACGVEEPKEYGATRAGPTKVSKPLIADQPPQVDDSAENEDEPKVVTSSAGLCKLYTQEQIGEFLGRSVREGRPGTSKTSASCVWAGTGKPTKTKGAPPVPIVVSITRAKATRYDTIHANTVEMAESRSAGGAQVIRGVGDEAFAIGASVKGVPIWYGGARHGDWMTVVEMSGGNSKAGVVSVTEFLLDIIEHG